MAVQAAGATHVNAKGITGHQDQPVYEPPKKKNYHDLNVGGVFAHAAKANASGW